MSVANIRVFFFTSAASKYESSCYCSSCGMKCGNAVCFCVSFGLLHRVLNRYWGENHGKGYKDWSRLPSRSVGIMIPESANEACDYAT